jgi:sensor histidine kinase YesM
MREPGSTLDRELELVRSFLTILQMRMGERLGFSIEAPAALGNARVPPMVLPTLVENAIKHGLSPLPEGGRIDIRAASTVTASSSVPITGRAFPAAAAESAWQHAVAARAP